MVDYRTDAQLIDACLAGDARAWAQLVERYQRLVYSVALRHHLSGSDADEVFQCVFVILLNKLDTCRNRDRLGAWLTTIARREALRVASQRSASTDTGDEGMLEAQPSPAPLPEAELEQLEEQHLVRQGLERLGERCRRLLERLFYAEEPPSYTDLARELAMPEGSIGPTRARCLEKLRAVLDSLGFGN